MLCHGVPQIDELLCDSSEKPLIVQAGYLACRACFGRGLLTPADEATNMTGRLSTELGSSVHIMPFLSQLMSPVQSPDLPHTGNFSAGPLAQRCIAKAPQDFWPALTDFTSLV